MTQLWLLVLLLIVSFVKPVQKNLRIKTTEILTRLQNTYYQKTQIEIYVTRDPAGQAFFTT